MLQERIRRIVELTGREVLDEGLAFQVVEIEEGTVVVDLLIDPQACADCVVPEETMSAILLKQIQRKFPVIQTVKVVRKEASEGLPKG